MIVVGKYVSLKADLRSTRISEQVLRLKGRETSCATHCSQAFKTARALSAHMVKAHPCEWNEEKRERHMARRPKHRWTDSDKELVYRGACEWNKMVKPSLSSNDYIRKSYFPELGREAIKNQRKLAPYKEYVSRQSSRDALPVSRRAR